MAKVNIDEIQQDLRAYLKRVQAGETLIILSEGNPVAELKPAGKEAGQLRPFGLCAGEFTVPDDFDAPLPGQLLKTFEGK